MIINGKEYKPFFDTVIAPSDIAEISKMLDEGLINQEGAKKLVEMSYNNGLKILSILRERKRLLENRSDNSGEARQHQTSQ